LRLVNDLIRFLAAMCIVFMFFGIAGHDALETVTDSVDMIYIFPFIVLPVVAMLTWVTTLKIKRHIAVPGFYWALLVVTTVLISLFMSGGQAHKIMGALSILTPCLLLPVMFQGTASSRDRRGLRAMMIALLLITLINLVVQMTLLRPSLAACFEEAPAVVAEAMHLDSEDEVGMADLSRRLNTTLFPGSSVYMAAGQFETTNILAIVLLILAAFARSIKKNTLCVLALLFMFFACQSKGIVLIFLLTLPLTKKRPNTLRAMCFGVLISLILWQPEVSSVVVEYLRENDHMRSVEFRVSYWSTAHNMYDTFGQVGLGQYTDYASAARLPGAHYSALPHNGFLKLVAELGLFAAVATFIWLAGLFRGQAGRRKEGGAPRLSLLLGAALGLSWCLLSGLLIKSSPMGGVFSLGFEIENNQHLVPRWFWWRVIYSILLLVVFCFSWWRLQKGIWKVGNGSLAFAAAAVSLHQFIEMDLNHACILVLFFTTASIGWLRRPTENRWTWHAFPILAILCLLGFMWVQNSPEENTTLIKRQIAKVDKGDFRSLRQLYQKWHNIKPRDQEPVEALFYLSVGKEKIYWLERRISCEPNNPRHHFELAEEMYRQNYAENKLDLILEALHKARDLDEIRALARYRLLPEEREYVIRQIETLKAIPQN
jgi:hypothetical protein